MNCCGNVGRCLPAESYCYRGFDQDPDDKSADCHQMDGNYFQIEICDSTSRAPMLRRMGPVASLGHEVSDVELSDY